VRPDAASNLPRLQKKEGVESIRLAGKIFQPTGTKIDFELLTCLIHAGNNGMISKCPSPDFIARAMGQFCWRMAKYPITFARIT